jgi:hypothetical protein
LIDINFFEDSGSPQAEIAFSPASPDPPLSPLTESDESISEQVENHDMGSNSQRAGHPSHAPSTSQTEEIVAPPVSSSSNTSSAPESPKRLNRNLPRGAKLATAAAAAAEDENENENESEGENEVEEVEEEEEEEEVDEFNPERPRRNLPRRSKVIIPVGDDDDDSISSDEMPGVEPTTSLDKGEVSLGGKAGRDTRKAGRVRNTPIPSKHKVKSNVKFVLEGRLSAEVARRPNITASSAEPVSTTQISCTLIVNTCTTDEQRSPANSHFLDGAR